MGALKPKVPLLIAILLFGSAVFLAVLNGWVALSFHQPLDSVRPWTWAAPPELWHLVKPEAFDEALLYAALSGAGTALTLIAFAFRASPESPHGDARWATSPEIRRAGLLEAHGVIIGKFGGPRSRRSFLRTKREDYSNILLVAPPGAGKGVGVVIPTLLTYPGSTIVLDVKGENFEATGRRRAQLGDAVFRFSPYDEEGRTHRFNPLDQARRLGDPERQYTELRRIATHLLVAHGKGDEPFIDGARELFAALASITLKSNAPTIGEVYRLLTPRSGETVDGKASAPNMADTFAALANTADQETARIVLGQFASYDQKTLSVYLSVLKSAGLNAWGDAAVDRATSASDFDLSMLRKIPTSIYLVIGPNDMETLGPVARLFFQSAIAALQRRLPAGDEPFPVLLVLDEFKSLGRMTSIANAATTLRGYGGRMLIVVQGAPNLEEVYGRAGRDGLMNACQLHAYMSLNDPSTKEMVSRSLGTREVVSTSESTSRTTGKPGFSRTRSEQARAKRLLSEDEIGRLGADDLLVLAQNLRPIRVRKVRYYADRTLKRLFRGQGRLAEIEIPDVRSKIVSKPEFPSVCEPLQKLSHTDAVRIAEHLNTVAKARGELRTQASSAADCLIDHALASSIAGYAQQIVRARRSIAVG